MVKDAGSRVFAFAPPDGSGNMELLQERAKKLGFILQNFNVAPAEGFGEDVRVIVIATAPRAPKGEGEPTMVINMTYVNAINNIRANNDSIPVVLVAADTKTVVGSYGCSMLAYKLRDEKNEKSMEVKLIPASDACVGPDLRDPFTFVVFSQSELKTEDSTEDEHLNAVLLCLAGQD